jgi:hypothetical protein
MTVRRGNLIIKKCLHFYVRKRLKECSIKREVSICCLMPALEESERFQVFLFRHHTYQSSKVPYPLEGGVRAEELREKSTSIVSFHIGLQENEERRIRGLIFTLLLDLRHVHEVEYTSSSPTKRLDFLSWFLLNHQTILPTRARATTLTNSTR